MNLNFKNLLGATVAVFALIVSIGSLSIAAGDLPREAPKHWDPYGSSVRVDVRGPKGNLLGHGSGTHIGGGRILTAAHVAQAAAEAEGKMEIVTDSGGVIGTPVTVQIQADHADVAILMSDGSSGLPHSRLFCDYKYYNGERVRLRGNPMGEFFTLVEGYTAQPPMRRYDWLNTMLVDILGGGGDSGGGIRNLGHDIIGVVVHGYNHPAPVRSFVGVVPANTVCEVLNING